MIYIPSFSVGVYGGDAKKNLMIGDKLSVRFYSKDYSAKYRHPYFLVTAGHFYKNMNYFEQMGFDSDSLILGDSGGFQIATGALEYSDDLRYQIFNWLEHNSNVAMNLDIPPRIKYEGQFDYCLQESKKNFKYFAENQSGKTKYLNVIQGSSIEEYDKWYQEVKDFEFNGWALGGSQNSIYRLMSAIMIIIKNKEYKNPLNEYIHILGATSITHFLLLHQLQYSLKKTGSKTVVMVDSSSPAITVVFGSYYIGFDLKNENMKIMHVPKIRGAEWDALPELKFIKTCEFDNVLEKVISFKECLKFEKGAYSAVTLHNFYYFKHVIDFCEGIVHNNAVIPNENLNPQTASVMKSIEEMIDASENGMDVEKIFKKYVPVYKMIDSQRSDLEDTNASKQIIDNFFQF